MNAPANTTTADATRPATRDFLVEIGTEELPPKSLLALSQAFTDGIVAGLAAAGVKHGKVQPYAAPRRLALLVKKVAERQPDQEIKRKGPPVSASFDASGAPTRAATAFAESCGTTVAALGRVQEAKGEFLFHSGSKAGAETVTLLAGLVQASLDKLPIAKRMRWGSGTAEFVRPVHWVVMLFGTEVVPATILGVTAGNATRGHRFMAPKNLVLASPASYVSRLEKAGKVVADFATRRERIRAGVLALAAEHGVEAIVSDALLDEVTALVEWPVPVAGRFEERFLDLPAEVLIATLQDHQRYFPTRVATAGGTQGVGGSTTADEAPKLTSLFITISNLESRDPAQVRAGNERVVRPRLSDAAFFWDTDRKVSLASRREALKDVTFQAQLGSYFDKTERVKALAARIAPLANASVPEASRAAELSKCDLLTGLVGEFPELQGTMGTYYARHDREAADVASAMGEQYLPRFAGDVLPVTGAGTALSIADKLDTIVGIFAIGQKPSGTKDPFALRRAALGVLRIVLEKKIDLDLPGTIDAALVAARADIDRVASTRAAAKAADATAGTTKAEGHAKAAVPKADTVAADVYDYVMERLRAHFLEAGAGITTEMFDAVLDRRPASPIDVDSRLRALAEFLTLKDAAALASANKRIANILRKAEEAKTAVDASALRADLLQPGEERALYDALAAVRPDAQQLLDSRDYTAAMHKLAALRPAVDAFFDKVMVMADDPAVRANRLALLAGLRALFLRVADLSRLPG